MKYKAILLSSGEMLINLNHISRMWIYECPEYCSIQAKIIDSNDVLTIGKYNNFLTASDVYREIIKWIKNSKESIFDMSTPEFSREVDKLNKLGSDYEK